MSHYQVHLEKAEEFYDDANYEAARSAAEYALSCALPGEGDKARMILALAMRKLEFNDEAFQMLHDLTATNPTPEANAEYALMCAERGICDDSCRSCALRAIDGNPDLGSAYMALFWCDVTEGHWLDALQNLRRGMHRGAEFSDGRAFELVRGWCQEACNQENFKLALSLSSEVVELFGTFDFLILHARLAEISGENRVAVPYYKKALNHLRPGTLRNEILEAIARIAI